MRPPRRFTGQAEIQPQLWVRDGPVAVAFYERAFGAAVEYLLAGPAEDDVIAQMSVGGAHFWLTSASEEMHRLSPDSIGGATGRVLLVVDDPDAFVEAAVAGGAAPVSAVQDEHGWRLGRLTDPFGHEWEIGRPLGQWPPQGG